MIAGLLVPITFFITAGFIVYYTLHTRNMERMKIIEQGVSGDDLKKLLGQIEKKPGDPLTMAKWGIILISVGLAILICAFVDSRLQEEITIGLIFLFPGIGLLIYYRLFGKVNHDSKNDDL